MSSSLPNGVSIKTALLGAVAGYFVTCKLPKVIGPIGLYFSEPGACSVMRETLLATHKIAKVQYKGDPTEPLEFPKIPFSLIEECGPESFNMPFPYTFKWTEDNIDAKDLVPMFLSKNKTVSYRPAADFGLIKNTPFNYLLTKLEKMKKGSFDEAWQCISKGKCSLYFDNTWVKDDYESIMPDNVVKTLIHGSDFGSMFMSNYKEYQLTAPAHAAPFKSLSTQITQAKKWVFFDPFISKDYLPVDQKALVTVVQSMAQDHEETLKKIPRYEVVTGPGDGLYFPEWWIHVVYTEPGVNTMTSWRMPAQVLSGFKTSPHTFGNKMHLTLYMFFKEYVFPDWLLRWRINTGQDAWQAYVHKMFTHRKYLFDENAGAKYL